MPKLFLPFISVLFFLSISAFAQAPVEAPMARVPDINGRATSLVKPAFPETAVDMGADGDSVSLMVVVDENGFVISAHCSLNCHPMLKDAAELAAMTSKFKPLEINGRAVRYD